MSTLLRQADQKFDRQNEQQTRTAINTRLSDEDRKTQRRTTSRGGVSMFEGKIALANGANNNVSLDYATYIYITGPSAAFSITGFKNGEKGAFIILRNSTAQAMTLANESASSSANNRIKCPGNADIVLAAANGSSVLMQYDTALKRWVIIASGAAALDRVAAALSILGRSANSTGADADIATTSGSNAVLKESGGTLAWGLILTANITDGNITTAKLADANVTTVKIADANVTYAKIQNVSATDKVLGRATTGAGVIEELACTAAGRAMLAAADANAQNVLLPQTSSGPAIGFRTGAGGVVTQATNKSTGVTLNKACGIITMNGASLASGASVTFTLTNSFIALGDIVLFFQTSVGTEGNYQVAGNFPAAGSIAIFVKNQSGGSLSEAIKISFVVIKVVTS